MQELDSLSVAWPGDVWTGGMLSVKRNMKPMSDDDASRTGNERRGEEERLRRLLAECETRHNEIAVLAARVRHEINNPLTGLLGQTQLLLREQLGETERRRVQTIEQLAMRIKDSVAELRLVQPAEKEKGKR